MQNDTLQSFSFEHQNVRGEIVHLNQVFQTALERHAYPEIIGNLLGETLTAVTLLGATLKLESNIILQIQPQSAIKLLVAQIDQRLHVRGLAQWDNEALPTAFNDPFHGGHLAITMTPKIGQRYQGVVALNGGNLANSIEKYFYQSEQLATCLFLCADKKQAAGILLQKIPDTKSPPKNNHWEDLVAITQSLTPKELLTLSNSEILQRLYHEEDIRLFDAQPIEFHCDCTIARMENAVRVLGYEEAMNLLRTHKTISVTCEFCNNRFDFSASDVARIFER